jgi:hypothetical protein
MNHLATYYLLIYLFDNLIEYNLDWFDREVYLC